MSYTPNTWQTGDTITAAKLNNMEQGIASAGGALVVNVTLNSASHKLTCDKTGAEVHAAYQSGQVCFMMTYEDGGVVLEEIASPSLVEKATENGSITYMASVYIYQNYCNFVAVDNGYLSCVLE